MSFNFLLIESNEVVALPTMTTNALGQKKRSEYCRTQKTILITVNVSNELLESFLKNTTWF